jgi:hypothetical protein
MRRRDLIAVFCSAMAAWPPAAIADDKGFTIGPAVDQLAFARNKKRLRKSG